MPSVSFDFLIYLSIDLHLHLEFNPTFVSLFPISNSHSLLLSLLLLLAAHHRRANSLDFHSSNRSAHSPHRPAISSIRLQSRRLVLDGNHHSHRLSTSIHQTSIHLLSRVRSPLLFHLAIPRDDSLLPPTDRLLASRSRRSILQNYPRHLSLASNRQTSQCNVEHEHEPGVRLYAPGVFDGFAMDSADHRFDRSTNLVLDYLRNSQFSSWRVHLRGLFIFPPTVERNETASFRAIHRPRAVVEKQHDIDEFNVTSKIAQKVTGRLSSYLFAAVETVCVGGLFSFCCLSMMTQVGERSEITF